MSPQVLLEKNFPGAKAGTGVGPGSSSKRVECGWSGVSQEKNVSDEVSEISQVPIDHIGPWEPLKGHWL